MKKLNLISCFAVATVVSMPAMSAGTYYTGGSYQSPQQRYTATGASPSTYAPTSYNQYNNASSYQRPTASQIPYQPVNATNAAAQSRTAATAKKSATQGFYIGAGISRQTAEWEFELKQAGSKLTYNNLSWNVLDVNAGYAFGPNAFGLKIDAGLQYGMQAGDSSMVDDDISNGGYLIATYYNSQTQEKIGDVYGNALSVGKSKGGDMLGFNFGVSLTDKFAVGKVKLTPSIGYRMLSYSLTTEENFGLSFDSGYCIQVPGTDEIQCDPFILVVNNGQTPQIIWESKTNSGGTIDTGGTYYYAQPGTSHKYDVSWNGPYLALDMDYEINENNAVSARVELGLPAYTAEGDQPYRPDWKHPKSVEDSGGIGDAYHLGLSALWSTAISKSVMLQVGLTYDYYTLSGASAKTYLTGEAYGIDGWANGTPYDTILSDIINSAPYNGNEAAALDPKTGSQLAIGIKDLKDSCPGWVCNTDGEVDSFYKSMGIRVGVVAKF